MQTVNNNPCLSRNEKHRTQTLPFFQKTTNKVDYMPDDRDEFGNLINDYYLDDEITEDEEYELLEEDPDLVPEFQILFVY